MPKYMIQRDFGKISDEQLKEAAIRSKRVRGESFPDITWHYSNVVNTAGSLKTFCVYEATSVERVREHAKAADLPADTVDEILAEVTPAQLP